MVYDVIVVGGGPAGLTAGVYARTRKLSTLILEAQATGGQLEWLYPTKSVYDYPSYIAIEGGELAELFVLHSRESGAEIRAEEVVDVQRQASGFKLTTREGNAYEARSIILAMGMGLLEPKRLGVPGEAEFESNGELERAVVYDNRTLKKTVLDVDAVIVNIGFEPKITPLPRWGVELEGDRLIRVKADMSTSVRGIYACGDMVSYPGKDKRIVTGCGEAVTAVMSVYKYLRQPYWA